jgi:hypothetical protein
MIFAMLYAEDSSIVGTYESREVALEALVQFVKAHPDLQDEIGLHPYEGGQPAGAFQAASELVPNALAQPHLL